MKTTGAFNLLFFLLLFSFSVKAQYTDTIRLTLQVGESYSSCTGAGTCVGAGGYDVSLSFPD
jgi:hypothetical protein